MPRSQLWPTQAVSKVVHTNLKRKRGSHGAQVILLGDRAVESTVDDNFVGTVEGFAFRARRSGTAASISVYLDTRNRATTVFAGLYSSRHGHPQSLLTSGLLRYPKAGAWNSVAVGSARLRSGTTYWLAVLGKGGAIYFRDRNRRLCTGERSSKRKCARFRDLARRPELARLPHLGLREGPPSRGLFWHLRQHPLCGIKFLPGAGLLVPLPPAISSAGPEVQGGCPGR